MLQLKANKHAKTTNKTKQNPIKRAWPSCESVQSRSVPRRRSFPWLLHNKRTTRNSEKFSPLDIASHHGLPCCSLLVIHVYSCCHNIFFQTTQPARLLWPHTHAHWIKCSCGFRAQTTCSGVINFHFHTSIARPFYDGAEQMQWKSTIMVDLFCTYRSFPVVNFRRTVARWRKCSVNRKGDSINCYYNKWKHTCCHRC